MKIAVIGLGTMGAPMAENLLRAGHHVTVHNRTRAREESVAAAGATRADTPAAAARGADIVLVCVSDTPDLEHVLLAPGTGAIEGVEAGGLVIDCSTVSPEGARRCASALSKRSVGFVDAPVSGGPEGARGGTLAIMCGASPADFERARPILEILGSKVTHVGPVGCGQIAKAVNQVIIAGTYQSVAEGITLAAKAGADPRKVVEAISGGAANSWILSNRAPNMLNDSYPLGFRVRLHRKDLAIALETARSVEAPMPLAALVAALEDALLAQGCGDEDVSALGRLARRSANLPDGRLGA